MHLHGEPEGERAKSRLLALQLIKLAVAAGWKPRECIEFAREAHKFVMSTQVAAQQLVTDGHAVAKKIPRKGTTKTKARPGMSTSQRRDGSPAHHVNGTKPLLEEPASARPKGSKDIAGGKRRPAQPTRPDWGPHPETRRNALQELANQNRSMREAAEILGVSQSLVSQMATRLKIRFHGRVGRRARPAAAKNLKAAPKPTKRSPARTHVNGEAAAKFLIGQAGSPRMQRRCPSCNQIFEAAKVSDYICYDCESSNYAGRRGSA